MHRVAVIFGTRPEAIKLAPIVLAMKRQPAFDCHVCVTGQHREMLEQVLTPLEIVPDADLNLMRPDQTLAGLTASAIEAIDRHLQQVRPELVLVQGDTTTAFCAALAALYQRIPLGHVEAGLRTGNLQSPWPEEANRAMISRLARLHFAPAALSRQNLLDEGVPDAAIFVTGNPGVDALFLAIAKIGQDPRSIADLPGPLAGGNRQIVLITAHRRENFGSGLESVCRAIAELASAFPEVQFVYPVHLNPSVRGAVHGVLGEYRLPNVHLLEPLGYLPLVSLMSRATLILTDSGGIQEEAPSLGKPVLLMRDATERPEAVAAGTVKLVGTDWQTIVRETTRLLTDTEACRCMSRVHQPYGDGQATGRILAACLDFLSGSRVSSLTSL